MCVPVCSIKFLMTLPCFPMILPQRLLGQIIFRGGSLQTEKKISIIIHKHHKHAFSHPIKYIAFCKLIPTHRLHVTVYTEKFHYFKKTRERLFL